MAGRDDCRVELIAVAGLPMVSPGDDLAEMVCAQLAFDGVVLRDDDIVVFAQKIVSKAEGRFVDLAAVRPSAEALELAGRSGKDPHFVEIVLRESRRVVRCVPNVLIVEHRLGFIMANAGVDHSNIGGSGRVLLLPEAPDASAERLRATLRDRAGVEVAVVINDSFGRPWRQGTVGVAIGVAGLASLDDRRGKADLFGRRLEVTVVGYADEVAAAASLVMGQGEEGRPVVIVRGLPPRGPATPASTLCRPAQEDLFR